jgi:hypothetical protein
MIPAPKPRKEIYLVLGYLIRETEKACLINIHEIEGSTVDEVLGHWIPKSQIVDSQAQDPSSEEFDRFNIKHWIMNERGLV